jgi:hypothetical protein
MDPQNITPQPQPTVQPVSPPVEPPKPKSNWLAILLVILLLVLVGLGGFIAGSRLNPSPDTSVISSPSIAPDPTADWKIIQNENWEFKVPTNWNYLKCSSELLFVGPSIPEDKNEDCAFDGSPGVVQVSRYLKSKNPEYKIAEESVPGFSISNRSQTIIDGKPAIMQIITISEGQGVGTTWQVYIQHSSEIIDVITLHDAGQKLTTFDPILSTFKFTNTNNSTMVTPSSASLISTTGWVLAENNVFSIKYPSDTFRTVPAGDSIQLQWKNNTGQLMTNSPGFVIVDNYTGGSVEEWYLNYHNYYPNEVVFTKKLLGSLNVVEAKPKNINETHILISNGKYLINVLPQGADFGLVETIASTLIFK